MYMISLAQRNLSFLVLQAVKVTEESFLMWKESLPTVE